jgi:ketosteroid isomerase-like protein
MFMTRTTGTVLLLVLVAVQDLSGLGPQSNDIETISNIEQQLAKAWVGRERATIDAILAPEWLVTDAAGRVLTKQQVMQESFDSADRKIDTMEIDDVTVRTFGDMAVATGRTRATGTYRGTSSSVVLRFTDVFVRRGGRWQVVASHASTVHQ